MCKMIGCRNLPVQMEEAEFDQLIEKFVERYKMEGWELKVTKNGKYGYLPRRVLSRTLDNESVFANYYVDWDEIYRVPVLSAQFYTESGNRVYHDQLMKLIGQDLDRASISEREHDKTGFPVFYLHPCNTEEFVRPFVENGANYLHVWMVAYGPFFLYKLPF